jgi:glycosyltransferase involved in cell wall biosynthesis
MRRPARILYCTSDFRSGGTQRYLSSLLRGLDRRRFTASVACLSDEGELAGEIRDAAASTRCYRIRDPLWHPRSLATIVRLSRWIAAEFDLVHTLVGHANVVGILATRLAGNRRIVVSQRSLHPISGSFREASPAMVALGRWLFRHAARRVLVNNRVIAEALAREGMPPGHVVTIENGVDLERFRPLNDRAMLRRAEGLDPQAPLVGFVGRLIPDKGLGRLLEAVGALSASELRPQVLVAGDGPERDRLEAAASAAGLGSRARFVGFRADAERIYPLLDLFVFPSTYSEGMPNVVLEAMACGVPVVAHRMLQTEAMLRHGETGWLVDCTSRERLAEAIQDLLRDRERGRALGEAAREHVRARHDLREMLRRTAEIYEAELAA